MLFFVVVSWLRQLVAGLFKHMSPFDPQLVRVEFEEYKEVLGEESLRALRSPCQSFHQTSIHIY